MEIYINPFTDFGFKKIFGEEVNKDLLIDFLNELLQGKTDVKDLTYLKTEHLGNSATDRRAIFDLYCENQRGEKFIVELQKVKQDFFKDRSIYYSTFAIQEQGAKGEWNYELKGIYTIGIMDFVFEEDIPHQDKFIHEIKLLEIDTCKVFFDKLTFIYLEMPKFFKQENELKSKFDKWLYVLKNLAKFQNRPIALQEKVFEKLFKVAEIAHYDQKDRMRYEDSLKVYRDMKNSLDTAFNDAKIETAKLMKQNGEPIEKIILYTGLSEEKIGNL